MPDNNHDFPLHPRKNRKRKRNEAMDGSDDEQKQCKRKRVGESMNLSPIRSPDVRKRKLELSAPVVLCSKLNLDQLDDYADFQTKFKPVCTFVTQSGCFYVCVAMLFLPVYIQLEKECKHHTHITIFYLRADKD